MLNQSQSIVPSLREFIFSFGKWGWILIVDIISGMIGTYQLARPSFSLSGLVLVVLSIAVFVIASFLAFHKVRCERNELDKKLNNRMSKAREAIQFGIDRLRRYENEACSSAKLVSVIEEQGHSIADVLGAAAETEFLRSGKYKDDDFYQLGMEKSDEERRAVRIELLTPYVLWLQNQLNTITADKIQMLWLQGQ